VAQRLEAQAVTYRISYFSALDNAIRQRGAALEPQVEELIAPSDWAVEQVEEAWLRQHPGSLLLTCDRINHQQAA